MRLLSPPHLEHADINLDNGRHYRVVVNGCLLEHESESIVASGGTRMKALRFETASPVPSFHCSSTLTSIVATLPPVSLTRGRCDLLRRFTAKTIGGEAMHVELGDG